MPQSAGFFYPPSSVGFKLRIVQLKKYPNYFFKSEPNQRSTTVVLAKSLDKGPFLSFWRCVYFCGGDRFVFTLLHSAFIFLSTFICE